ncbi:MAG: hydantoinase B/oxoprolinase family protein [Chloroflexi bacterium]|nr:hydantoinase B/oxoprolinase family protein [Chloroflexota bacterium]
MSAAVDPITLALIRNRLVAGAEQMAVTLWKSSFSTVIREVLDYSTAIFDVEGRMVAQSSQIPFQMMTMSAPMGYLIRTGYDWQPGDVVLLNDPYACEAQHLPDYIVLRPAFSGGELIGFAGAIGHMLDTGGGAAGGYLASATEIYHEGLRIPPSKIIRGGEVNEELLQLIGLNVREPEKLRGDLTAMWACTSLGEATLHALADEYGPATARSAMAEILDSTERQVRQRLALIPEGTYRGVDHVDDDGITDDPLRIEATVTRRGDTLEVDFAGTSPQPAGPVSATMEMTRSSVMYVAMATIGEDIPKNDAWRRAITVRAPERSLVNAGPPAPVASRVTTCHRIVDAMMQALVQAIPDRVTAGYYGASNICNIGGFDPDTGAPWVHFEIEVGGWGARPTADGLDAYSAHVHNLATTPIEVVESNPRLRVEHYSLLPGTGGAGKFRGGLGLRRDIRVLVEGARMNLLGDHYKFAPLGMLGGEPGVSGRYVLNPDSKDECRLPNKVSNMPMAAGDVISMQTSGGGGYGDPSERDPALIERDRREEKI